MLNIFYKDKSQYHNQLDPVRGYLEQLATFISVKKGIPIEEATDKAKLVIKKHFKDKPMKYFERQDNGDRHVKEGTLLNYIKSNIRDKNILAPTFTSYVNMKKEKSILSEFIFVNVKKRGIAKKEGQKAKAEGKLEIASAKNNEQNNLKTYNNSLSGVFGQKACILHNPTAHNTLTSITRTMTSLGNSSNEKLIAGNRYLPRPIDVLNSCIYITTYTDEEAIRNVVSKFNLHLPTVDEVVSVLRYSSDLYFYDTPYYCKHIIPFLNRLSPYQLASIVYSGDLYHLRLFNDSIMRTILEELITPIVDDTPMDDPTILYKVDESTLCLTHAILYEKMKGKGKDYVKLNSEGISKSVYLTVQNVQSVLLKYAELFRTFFMTEMTPTNTHRIANMKRRVVMLSDTDSTCFTTDEWIVWYNKGTYHLNDKTMALGSGIAYITSQAIINQLAILSKSMNVDDDFLNTLSMKNEYTWLTMVPCKVSKHYFASTVVQEGNVFPEFEIEVKGQLLKNSAMPVNIIQNGKDAMTAILSNLANNKKIRLTDFINNISEIEHDITDSVTKGKSRYLRRSKVKGKDAYAQDEFKSPYQRYTLWMEVFAPKYGDIAPPPFNVIKIPTIVNSKRALVKWLESIEDVDLRERLVDWLNRHGKKDLPTVYLYDAYLESNGIPKEIFGVIDLKRILLDTTLQHRTLLECLGVMLQPELTITEQFNSLKNS